MVKNKKSLFFYHSQGKWSDQRQELKDALGALKHLPERSASWLCLGILETFSKMVSGDNLIELTVNVNVIPSRIKKPENTFLVVSPKLKGKKGIIVERGYGGSRSLKTKKR